MNDNSIKNIFRGNINESEIKEIKVDKKFEEFKKKFEKKLIEFGQYIEKEQFEELIPENVRLYMTQNDFQIPDNIKINDNTYEMKPIKFRNDSIYAGHWNDKIVMDGLGKYFIKDGNLFIEGIWEDGRSTYGRIYYPNNNIYEGYIKNSNCEGKGKLIYESGDVYEGDFKEGDIEGYGKFTFSDKTTYEGQFSKGNLNGQGIMKWANGITYEGNFTSGVLNNKGRITGIDGEQYEGDFLNNYFNGKGKYIFEDGSTYEGDYESGLRNGKGIYKKKDEFSYEGSWANDYPHGFGTYTFGSVRVKGIWRNGINAEISKLEGCEMNEFNHKILNFKIPESNLIPDRLPNLTNVNSYKNFATSNIPSYLNSREEV